MKLNLTLASTAKPAQRSSHANPAVPLALLAAHAKKPLRIPTPMIANRPVLRGDRHYLRALRAAEMAAWNAGQLFQPITTVQ